jgi:serine/threonine protein kinase/formylglycine-generating enzyme required for sulfatase activity
MAESDPFKSEPELRRTEIVSPAADAPPPELPDRIGRYRIEKVLGKGGYGVVYLGHDDKLDRPVAIKVPHVKLVSQPKDAEAYLTEARTVAKLDHPNIVPVHDVGSTEKFACYVVSKYVEGSDLSAKIEQRRLSGTEAAELIATVAEALHYAHTKGLVHRDIKPANILLDATGEPFVTDFGVALKEEDFGKGKGHTGTPAYMSPEQARGEGHRVDGRSDIFSLGIVFYELLVGKPPFNAKSTPELVNLITTLEVRPPRQIVDRIPGELERICLKALAKRATERYTTARDMADDLRYFLSTATPQTILANPARQSPTPAIPAGVTLLASDMPLATPASGSPPIRIVPKGLRSFDEHDADFFLELLPGPRDREGLPDSLRFWKIRIEETDTDNTFSVGLIYGPSGCGKSSLVKAGLLPLLSDDVIPVYVESTRQQTETRLLNVLRMRCPALLDSLNLKETLAALRRGQGIPIGKKVLIVLDQFEQWLHARKEEENTELVQALRQCDGQRVQCIVMVRDDFWLAVSRFLQELEIRLVEGQNSALVDLFDLDHARKVLAAFGRAFGKLPESESATTREQKEFLQQSVAGLARDGKVICVRLALFAEMMKGKPWTPTTLKEVGGTEGIGVNFLEETFSASTAPPEHRLHQKAARGVLKALLPESGSNIKGHMRYYDELLESSDYTQRPKDFDELIRILDSDIRLITPTDPEGMEPDDDSVTPTEAGRKYYQLTHDYLVPSLRNWLTRKLKETRRGRAEFGLAERSASWNAKPKNRYLPSWWEWASIRSLTDKKSWTEPQRKMMKRAGRFHGVRFSMLVIVLALLGWGGFESYGTMRGSALVESLKTANIDGVPRIVDDLIGYRRWTNDELHSLAGENNTDADTRLHASLALLPTDPTQLGYLKDRLLNAEPEQVETIRALLANSKDEIVGDLWRVTENPNKGQEKQLLQAASALAVYDAGNDAKWTAIVSRVVDALVNENSLRVAVWIKTLKPTRRYLIKPLGIVYRSKAEDRSQTEIDLATEILEQYVADDLKTLSELLLDGQPKQFVALFEEFETHGTDARSRLNVELARQPLEVWKDAERETLARRQANAAVATLRMGQAEKVWPLLKHSPDPRLRSWIIHRISPMGARPGTIANRLEEEPEVSIRRALILILGEFESPSSTDRNSLAENLLNLYETDPDAGIHAAAEWVLRRWGQATDLAGIDTELASGKVEGERNWYVTKQGHTMVVVPGPVEFSMGSPDTEKGRRSQETLHRKHIGRSFAIATKEVTVKQFQEFLRQTPSVKHVYRRQYAPEENCPQTGVTWYEAAAYCRWLSEQEGIPEDQMCYPPIAEIKEGMKPPSDYLSRTGYRLLTGAEWEYACRSKTVTSRYYGETEELLGQYAWYLHTSDDRTWPVGSLKPNDTGLFDMQGNVYEWCQERSLSYSGSLGSVSEDREDNVSLRDSVHRLLRGCSFANLSSNVRSACRNPNLPTGRHFTVGFRPVRTYP